jgi:DNA polymerase III subunit epsilon
VVTGRLELDALLPPELSVDASDRAARGIRIELKRGAPPLRAVPTAIDCGGHLAADLPIRSLEYAVVDVETTGGSFERGHRVTEIAAVRLAGDGTVLGEFRTLVNPDRPIPAFITALTAITWEMVRGAPRFGEIAGDVARVLEGAVFVAHNAPFDWRFVSAELGRAGTALTGAPPCTVRLARKLVPELRSRSLDSLTCFFDIPVEARHRAWGDAVATAELLRRLLRRLDDHEVTRWSELDRLLRQRAPRRKPQANPHSAPEA